MEKPNYVLKANEGVLVPKNENLPLGKMKLAVWIIVGVIIIGSLLFQDNLFSELSGMTQILLIVIAIGVTFTGGSKMVASPFEIQFYDDYLIVYREKLYYSKKLSRKEYFKFFYKDVKDCRYRKNSQKINIIGMSEIKWYNYNKDGSVPEQPTIHKKSEGICWFYTSKSPEIDFVAEIEKHTPLKVNIRDS